MKLLLFKNVKYAIAVGLIAVTTVGCGKATVIVYHGTEDHWDYPKTVAILPFSYDNLINKYYKPFITNTVYSGIHKHNIILYIKK